jgi:hypothetical protein
LEGGVMQPARESAVTAAAVASRMVGRRVM